MEKNKENIGIWRFIVAILLILLVLNYTLVVLSGANDKITFLGRDITAIGTESLEPAIKKGSICISKEPDEKIKAGDLVIYEMNAGYTGKSVLVLSEVKERNGEVLKLESAPQAECSQIILRASSVDSVVEKIIEVPYMISAALFSVFGLIITDALLLAAAAIILKGKRNGINEPD